MVEKVPSTPALPTHGESASWVDYLGQVELPVLAQTLRQVGELADCSNTTVSQLADVILRDPDLTSKVLRLSNTVFYNASLTPVSTVSRAITRIGFESVRAMAISSVIIDTLMTKNPRGHLLRCLAHSLHAAVQSRELARISGAEKREEVFIGALLNNIGEMAFWSCRTPQADALDQAMNELEPAKAQQSVLGTSFDSITRGLVDSWCLGPFVKEVVSNSSNKSPAASLVRESWLLVEAAEAGWQDNPELDEILTRLSKTLNEPIKSLRARVEANAESAAKMAVNYGIKDIAALFPQRNNQPIEEEIESRSNPLLQLQILRELSALLIDKPDLNMVCQMVLEGIQRAIGMQRVALLMRNRQEPQLVCKKMLGSGAAHWKDKFVINLNDPDDILAQLCKSHDCLLFNGKTLNGKTLDGKNTSKGKALPEFDRFIGRKPGLIGPLYVGERLVGCFYADNANAATPPNAEQQLAFSHFVQQAQLCLNNLAESKTG